MARAPTEKYTILIADPELNMVSLIAGMLRGIGPHAIKEVTDLRQLRSALAASSVDLMIVDEDLGPRGPLDVVRQMRSDPQHPNRLTPIIMTSAAPDATLIARARDAGVTEFLRKPFSAADLRVRIASLSGKPRAFVDVPSYAGPDRRRRTTDIGAAEQRGTVDDEASRSTR